MDCPLSLVPRVEETAPVQISLLLNGIFCIVISVLSVGTNMLVLLTVHRKPVFSTNPNILLETLAAVDLLTGLLAVPVFVAYQFYVVYGNKNCILATAVLVALQLCIVLSVIVMIFISLERSLAILKPLKYQSLVTRKGILYVLLASWFIWLVILTVEHTLIHHSKTFCAATGWFFCACFVLTTVLYVKMCKVAKRHQNAVAALQTDPEITARMLKERKALITALHVIGAFIVCHMPLVLSMTIVCFRYVVSPGRNSFLLMSWVGLLALSNSCLNPFIYCWRDNRIKRGMLSLLRCRDNSRIRDILQPSPSEHGQMYRLDLPNTTPNGSQ